MIIALRFCQLFLMALGLTFGLGGPAHAEADCRFDVKDLPPLNAAAPSPIKLAHGVNLSQWWENQQDRALNDDDIRTLRAWGVDFVRLPVSPKWLTIADTDAQREQLRKLRCDLLTLAHSGLKIVVDLHPPGSFDKQLQTLAPAEAEARIAALWQTLRPVLADLPSGQVALGLYNEPHFDTDTWWAMQRMLVATLRPIYPRNSFVATPSPDSGLWNFKYLEPYADTNVIYDFHFYEPLTFTHHGAEWLPNYDPQKAARAIPYPVDPQFDYDMDDSATRRYVKAEWNESRVAHMLAKAVAWKDKYHVEIACLEFGVYRPHTDEASRMNWLRDVRATLEANGIPWAVWEYRGPFGFVGPNRDFDENMAKALGLRHTPPP